MALLPAQQLILEAFLDRADFTSGSVILDLDGTALIEHDGKVAISGAVEAGVKNILALESPVILNTLRFPLSVIRTIAEEWLALSDQDQRIPVILLNGSLLGFIEKKAGIIVFDEIAAFPLKNEEIEDMLSGISDLIKKDIHDILLFYYPRDWHKGEILWVPGAHMIPPVKEKYQSAVEIFSSDIPELKKRMQREQVCMSLVLVNQPRDVLMSYQHKEPTSFFTTKGVDKSFGTREMARLLNVFLPDSVGAGDTMMDCFLSDVGLSVTVGTQNLPFKGIRETIRLDQPHDLGELLTSLAYVVQKRRLEGSN